MNWKTIFYLLFIIFISACGLKNENKKDLSGTDYIYIKDKSFMNRGKIFFPLMLNYAVGFRNIEDKFYISPILQYENPEIFESNSKTSIENQIRAHFTLINEMGFNTIRICFDRVFFDDENKAFYFPADEKKLFLLKDYKLIFEGLKPLFKIASENKLKIMLLIKPPVENPELECFTKLLLQEFSNETTLFAFDFFNEPLYFDLVNSANKNTFRKKADAFKIVKKWKQMMLDYAPNQLFTIGFAEPLEVFEWDPSILPVDFIAFHTYHPLRVPNEIYWYSKYINKPWMIGETALPADGDSISYEEQKQFYKEVFKRVINCGGSGIGWWEFQEPATGNFEAKYTAILNHKGVTKTKKGNYSIIGTVKPVVDEIIRLKDFRIKENCECNSNYYNMLGYNNFKLIGKVYNKNTMLPIEGAVIRGWNNDWSIGQNTFTNKDGEFTLYSNDVCIYFEVSAPKMSNSKFSFNTNYIAISNYNSITDLPSQKLEYHNISYKTFLKYPIDSIGKDDYIFNFEESKFNQAKFVGHMGIIKLEPLDFVK